MSDGRDPGGPARSPVSVEVEDGRVVVRDIRHSELPPLRFSMNEWAAFLEGVRRGEFDVPGQS